MFRFWWHTSWHSNTNTHPHKVEPRRACIGGLNSNALHRLRHCCACDMGGKRGLPACVDRAGESCIAA